MSVRADAQRREDALARIGVARLVARAELGSEILASALRAARDRPRLASLESYCMFIGYPRSGHSLMGSLLDVHEDIVIAHELDALKYLRTRLVGRSLLMSLILRNAERFTERGRRWTGYSYAVPGSWQGRTIQPRVIGDKKGGASTAALTRHPELLSRLRDTVRLPIRMIHLVRNPFDNIATMHVRGHGSLESCASSYFESCTTNQALRAGPDPVLDVRHEDMIADPRTTLAEACSFVGVGVSDAYLDACASIVFAAPHRSRNETPWTSALIDRVQSRIADFPFLEGYGFHD